MYAKSIDVSNNIVDAELEKKQNVSNKAKGNEFNAARKMTSVFLVTYDFSCYGVFFFISVFFCLSHRYAAMLWVNV